MATSRNVIIVDDDRELLQALALRCRSDLELETRTFTDGLTAMMDVARQLPDLMITDVGMPAVDGLTVCEQLLHDSTIGPLPIIVLTGRSDSETIARCKSLGAHYVLKHRGAWEQLRPIICELLELQSDDAPTATSASPAVRKAPCVLSVDDDPAIPKAIRLRLRGYGVDVLRAYSGMQGYWMALRERPDVIITDFSMPGGFGNYLLGRLQSHALTRDIPVLMLTGKNINGRKDFALERELISLGAKAFLSKPIDFQVLLGELQNYITFPERPAQDQPMAAHRT